MQRVDKVKLRLRTTLESEQYTTSWMFKFLASCNPQRTMTIYALVLLELVRHPLKPMIEEPFSFLKTPPNPTLLESTKKLPSTFSTAQSKEEGCHITCNSTKISAITTRKQITK